MTDRPLGWTQATLADVADWGSGGTPKAGEARYYDNGTIPWAVIGDLNDGHVTTTSNKITALALKESSSKLVSPGTILVAMYGSIGKLGIATKPMATNQAIAYAHPRDSMSPKYLFWFLLKERDALFAAGKGATQRNISQTILKAWTIPIAPPAEQERIVAAIEEQFSRLDAGVTALERVRYKLRQLRNAILATTFDGDWPRAKLGEIATVDSGPAFQSQFFRDGGEGIRLLRGDNIEPGRLRWLNERTWPLEMLGGYEHLAIAESDLILAMDRPIISTGLKLAPVSQSDLPALLVQRVARIRTGKAVLTPFLHLALQQPSFIPHLLAGQTGTQLPHITLRGIRSFAIPLPRIEDQHRVVVEVERQLSLVDALAIKADLAMLRGDALRASILSAAFSGKLVSQDPNDESASVLLERIASQRASSNGHKSVRAPRPEAPSPDPEDTGRHERRTGIQLMWEDGYTMADIAETMEISSTQVSSEMTRMRRQGWDLPKRRRKVTA